MFSAASFAGAFSGLLAAAIENMNGKRGLSGWAWIFILVRCTLPRSVQDAETCTDLNLQEGIVTTIVGLLTAYFMPATPMDAPFLTLHEKVTYTRALADSWSGDNDADGKAVDVFKWSEVFSCITDSPHTLLLCVLLFFNGTSVSNKVVPSTIY